MTGSYRIGVIRGDGTGPEVVGEGLKVLDRYTLRITLTRPDYSFLHLMALPQFGAVAREVVVPSPRPKKLVRP